MKHNTVWNDMYMSANLISDKTKQNSQTNYLAEMEIRIKIIQYETIYIYRLNLISDK